MTSAPPFTRKKLQCKSVLKAYPSPCSGTKKLNLRLIHLNAGEGKKKEKRARTVHFHLFFKFIIATSLKGVGERSL